MAICHQQIQPYLPKELMVELILCLANEKQKMFSENMIFSINADKIQCGPSIMSQRKPSESHPYSVLWGGFPLNNNLENGCGFLQLQLIGWFLVASSVASLTVHIGYPLDSNCLNSRGHMLFRSKFFSDPSQVNNSTSDNKIVIIWHSTFCHFLNIMKHFY